MCPHMVNTPRTARVSRDGTAWRILEKELVKGQLPPWFARAQVSPKSSRRQTTSSTKQTRLSRLATCLATIDWITWPNMCTVPQVPATGPSTRLHKQLAGQRQDSMLLDAIVFTSLFRSRSPCLVSSLSIVTSPPFCLYCSSVFVSVR